MRDRISHWESNFAKLCILRDACKDSSAALYIIAYLVAGKSDDELDAVLTATREWQAANAPKEPVRSIYDPRD